MRFISLFASFGHNFKYSSSSHIFPSCPIPICDSHKFHPWSPLHFPSPRLRNLSRHTRHTLTYKSATHETRHQRYGRPIARRRFSRWINSFSSRWLFFAPFFPTTFAVPLTNDYCLSEIRTATISHRVSITFDGGAENVAIPASVFILFYSFASTIVGCARVFVSFLKARRFLLPVTEERENIAR